MTKTPKTASATDPTLREAVIYARVSSKEQEKEGFSIPAQLKLLKDYAAVHGFAVAQEYVDVETAKQTGRAAFGEMGARLPAGISSRSLSARLLAELTGPAARRRAMTLRSGSRR